MTKPWETYEAVIKELYAKHTLATVQEIMEQQYQFKASVRAYRQRLDAWGCKKYKEREGKSTGHSKGGSSASKSSQHKSSSSKTTYQSEEQISSVQHPSHSFDTSTAPPGNTFWPSASGPGYDAINPWGADGMPGCYPPTSSMVDPNYGLASVSSDGYYDANGIWYPYDTASHPSQDWSNSTSNPPPQQNMDTETTGANIDEEDEEYASDYSSGRSYSQEGSYNREQR